eukprot:2682884-Prymnesium_polylepis.1
MRTSQAARAGTGLCPARAQPHERSDSARVLGTPAHACPSRDELRNIIARNENEAGEGTFRRFF